MAMIEQQTFIASLNNTREALNELSSFAETLSNRLVGYGAEGSDEGHPERMPSDGYLPSVAATAAQMSQTIAGIRYSLNRINQALPPDEQSKVSYASARSTSPVEKAW